MSQRMEQVERSASIIVAKDRNGKRKGRAGDRRAVAKLWARRVFRRLGKRLLDDAPTRYPFAGYEA